MDFPIKNGDFPWQNISLPEGTPKHEQTCVGVLDATLCRCEVIQFTAAFPACVNHDPGIIIDGTINSDMGIYKQQKRILDSISKAQSTLLIGWL